MKKKVLGIVLATVLALSLGLVLAGPVVVSAGSGNLLTNPGAETGDLTGWDSLGGASAQPVVNESTGPVEPYVGSYLFLVDGYQTDSEMSQDVVLPPLAVSFSASGQIQTELLFDTASKLTDNDYGELVVTFYDSLDNPVGSPFSTGPIGNPVRGDAHVGAAGYAEFSLTGAVPSDAVKANYELNGYWGDDHTGNNWTNVYYDDLYFEVDVASIEITKEADREYVYEGGTINYTYTVHNDGDIPLGPVAVSDSLPITVTPVLVPPRPGFNIGDINPQNGLLDPCEYWQYTASYTVPDPCDRPAIVNIAKAVAGTGMERPTRVRDQSDRVRVIILHPCVEIEKWTTEYAYFNGTEITYYYGVHNCGDTELELHRVMDTTLGEDANEILGADGVHNRGDLRNKGVWDPCETWYFSLDHTLECPPSNITYSDFCNHAEAAAFEPILKNRFFDDTTWQVRIFQWLPRTIGFWGNWDNHLTDREMWNLIHDVKIQSDYFGERLEKDLVHDFLLGKPPKFKGDKEGKARYLLSKQLLAAWLSVKSYEAHDSYGNLNWAMNPNATVYINGVADGTVIELLHRIEAAIDSMDEDGLLRAKDILEAMNSAESNNYEMFLDPDFDPTAPCR